MQLKGGMFLFTLMCIALCENKKSKVAKMQDIINLLGFLQEYKIGHDYNLQLPTILLPVFIVPSLRKQVVNIGNRSSDNVEGAQDHKEIRNNKSDLYEESSDIRVHFRQALNRGIGITKDNVSDIINYNSTLKQIDTVDNNMNIENDTEIEQTTAQETAINIKAMIYQTTTDKPGVDDLNGSYPTPNYNNEAIQTLTLTDTPSIVQILPYPNNDWINFTTSLNLSTSSNTSTSLEPDVTGTNPSNNPYPASLYNNSMIDTLSITTNSYTNEESPLPPPRDDRWERFSSLGKISISTSNGFKPLAGLYYDGYFNRPVIKTPGFMPYNTIF